MVDRVLVRKIGDRMAASDSTSRKAEVGVTDTFHFNDDEDNKSAMSDAHSFIQNASKYGKTVSVMKNPYVGYTPGAVNVEYVDFTPGSYNPRMAHVLDKIHRAIAELATGHKHPKEHNFTWAGDEIAPEDSASNIGRLNKNR